MARDRAAQDKVRDKATQAEEMWAEAALGNTLWDEAVWE